MTNPPMQTKDDLRRKISGLSVVIKATLWMARRYAHGRHTYCPGMFRDEYEAIRKWYPELLPKHDETIEPPKPEDVHGMQFRSDYLDDCND